MIVIYIKYTHDTLSIRFMLRCQNEMKKKHEIVNYTYKSRCYRIFHETYLLILFACI